MGGVSFLGEFESRCWQIWLKNRHYSLRDPMTDSLLPEEFPIILPSSCQARAGTVGAGSRLTRLQGEIWYVITLLGPMTGRLVWSGPTASTASLSKYPPTSVPHTGLPIRDKDKKLTWGLLPEPKHGRQLCVGGRVLVSVNLGPEACIVVELHGSCQSSMYGLLKDTGLLLNRPYALHYCALCWQCAVMERAMIVAVRQACRLCTGALKEGHQAAQSTLCTALPNHAGCRVWIQDHRQILW